MVANTLVPLAALLASAPVLAPLTPEPAAVLGLPEVRLDLAGSWRFHPAPPPEPWSAESAAGWPEIAVPGEWAMHGFTVGKDKAAAYLRTAAIPAPWAGMRIRLRCDGVQSRARVWVNGAEAGGHEGGFTPFELDVTPFVHPGRESTLALAVANDSLADTLACGSQYAAHQLGGITRGIRLFALPPVHLADLTIRTDLDELCARATLRLLLELANEGDESCPELLLELALAGAAAAPALRARFPLPPLPPGARLAHEVSLPVAAPRLWHAEEPNLYTLELVLRRGERELERLSRRIGFRCVEVQEGRLLVNRWPVKLRGVNRHEVHPLRGRSLTAELQRRDARLFRDANVNYIRTSHYPPDEAFLDACDQLGLFVEVEAPLVWLGHGAGPWQGKDPHAAEYGPPIIQAVLETIRRDRNHPCVLLWSLANESAWGPNFAAALAAADLADPTRPKAFHDQAWGSFNNLGSTALPVGNQHYPGPGGPARAAGSARPMLFGEYCHLNTYNRREVATDPGARELYGLALLPMWEAIQAEPACLGGAIWSGLDDVFRLPGGRVVGYGSWGPLDGWRREKPEYWHIRKIYAPIRVLADRLEPGPGGALAVPVENRHDATDLARIRVEWRLGAESGTAAAAAPPGGRAVLEIRPDPRSIPTAGEELRLRFLSPRGFVIDETLLPVGPPPPALPPPPPPAGKVELAESTDAFHILNSGFAWEIDRATGMIRRALAGDREVLAGGPLLALVPLEENSGAATDHRSEVPPLDPLAQGWRAESVAADLVPGGVEVRVAGAWEEARGGWTLRFGPGGRLELKYRITVTKGLNPRQTGMTLLLPRTCDRLAWKRRAQWPLYPPDHIGRPEGEARAFPAGGGPAEGREEPSWPWANDWTELGSNDFRATRTGILEASLRAPDGRGVRIRSDGTQAVRAAMAPGHARLLVADFTTGGNDGFLRSHYQQARRPLVTGAEVAGTVRLELLPAAPLMPRPEHGLRHDTPAARWDEALPLGNGLLGALVWGDGRPLKISLDRTDLWDLRPVPEFDSPDYSYAKMRQWVREGRAADLRRLYEDPYHNAGPTKIPAGRIELDLAGAPFREASLDLAEAAARIAFQNGAEALVVVHAEEPLGFIAVTGGRAEPRLAVPRFAAEPGGPATGPQDLARLGYGSPVPAGGEGWTGYTQRGWGDFRFAVALAWEARPGGWLAVWSVATSAEGTDPLSVALERCRRGLARGLEPALASHRAWWRAFWGRCGLRLPDPVLERLWHLETYKFGAAARPDTPPITLQGPWTADDGRLPPWKGDYHHDLNTELSYWPCYAGNRLEEGSGFLSWLWRTRDNARAWTGRFFGLPGLNVPMTADLAQNQIGGWHQYTHSATTAAWLAHHFWLHWRYTMDRDFLRGRAFPFLDEAAVFLEAVTEKGPDGRRALPLSSSPEIHDNSLAAWFPAITNYDLALIRWLFAAAADLAGELGLEERARHWRERLAEMPELARDPGDGRLLVAPGRPLEASHRHHSHLMAIHPLGLLAWEGGEADRRTIRASLADQARLGTSLWTGYSFAWRAALGARARDGAAAAQALATFATAFCLKNSFHCNGDQSGKGYSQFTYRPFTLEGNFAAAAAIQEMLLQSHGGWIRLFPAVPASWREASFSSLRAEGAFLVSAELAGGEVARVEIMSERGGPCRLEHPFGGGAFKHAGVETADVATEKGAILLRTRPGQRIVLEPGDGDREARHESSPSNSR